ncbi:hypothetical protein E2562_019344 [Oryza meyeriana var. granulata]|uniref:Uncharacterized protein n=1 Tax=Oryza meyeriana var. granulata TaxID=110450 RepID=A0A6G1BN62_9ORYZ|nr:hypothetical protein E2562_019344 [Oryza meyeriana var. granulata]
MGKAPACRWKSWQCGFGQHGHWGEDLMARSSPAAHGRRAPRRRVAWSGVLQKALVARPVALATRGWASPMA